MRIVALTDERIAKVKPGTKRLAVYDPAVPGLAVRVQPSGHKTFVFGAKYPAQKAASTEHVPSFTRLELGEVGHMTLAAARAKAQAWAALIAAGVHPRDEEARTRKIADTVAGTTFKAVAEEFIARHLPGQRKARRVEREIRHELIPHWGTLPITAITRRHVAELIENIVARPAPTYAHNIFGHVRTLFDWAINSGKYDFEASPCDRLRPKKLIGSKKTRERVLDDHELKSLWHATDNLKHYPFDAVVKLLLLTGARLNEVTGATWSEFDLEKRLWVVPAARFKMNAQHFVPLTEDMLAVLGTLPHWRGGDHVFTTTQGRTAIYGFSHPVKVKLEKATGADAPWTLHDIRRTVRTRLAALRVPEPIAELVIGHARRGMGAVYDRHEYRDELREALTAWNALLRSITNPPPSANIVPLAGARKAQ
jgi:integrase